jgi:hypothetical protein
VAWACGITETTRAEAQVDDPAERVNRLGEGPLMAVVRIDSDENSRCLPSRDGVALKRRMRRALGLDSM